MELSGDGLRRAQHQAEETRRGAPKAAGLDSEQFSRLTRAISSTSDLMSRQALATQFAVSEKVIGLGVPALGAVTAAAWGVDRVASKWAQLWPQMTSLAEHAGIFHEALFSAWKKVRPLVEQVSRSASIAAEFQRMWREALPPNLRDIEDLRVSALVDFTAEEGIPLYLVPRASTVEAFLRAEDRTSRRAILTSRSHSITVDCRQVWREHRTLETQDWIDLLKAGLQAYEKGHTEAAQALFTVVLDTITFALPLSDRKRYTNRPNGSQDFEHLLDEEDLGTALAVLPLWSVHEQNWANQGHPVPRPLNRHASLHRASNRQYSKRNAIQALMLATSLLGWFAEYGRKTP